MQSSIITAICLLLISHLGDEDWKSREKAYCRLQRMLPIAASYLQAGKKSTDTETAVRCQTLYKEYLGWWWTKGIYREFPVLPWFDCLPWDKYPERMYTTVYVNQARSLCKDFDSKDWADFRMATWIVVGNWLDEGRSVEEISAILRLMVLEEKRRKATSHE